MYILEWLYINAAPTRGLCL